MNREHFLFLGPEDRPPRKRYVTTTFRVPRWLSQQAHAMARAEDLTFSQFIRRGIRRQLAAAGIPVAGSEPRKEQSLPAAVWSRQ